MKRIISVLIIILRILFYSPFVHLQTIPFRFRIVTWNVGNSEPDCHTFKQLAFAAVADGNKADLIAFGFQEASKKLIGTSTFHKTLKHCLQNNNYIEMISDYVGSNIIKPIWLYLYISNTTKRSHRVELLKYNKETTFKVYQDKILENVVGYKGVIAGRIRIDKLVNLVFVNMHLPAGEGKGEERCKLWSKFLQTYEATNFEDNYMFAFGDQNWRTLNTLNINTILKAIKEKQYQTILDNDELTQMRQKDNTENSLQCLSTFFEAPITFPPTYKYIPNSDEYQTEKDNEERRPSYTDRILISPVSTDLQILQYSAINNIKLSDHRPVFADIMLYQQSKSDKTPEKSYTKKRIAVKTDIEQSTQTNRWMIIIIIIITIKICILGILAIYHFTIKRQTKEMDIQQTSPTDFVRSRSNSENTIANNQNLS